ncbi:hypothetical protein bcere0030_32880 [Bacillus cereus AH1273]|nr:hypothetical protein bcere0030_32880 [Bacillus cereus AH1273]
MKRKSNFSGGIYSGKSMKAMCYFRYIIRKKLEIKYGSSSFLFT